jgi:uncharacterized protein
MRLFRTNRMTFPVLDAMVTGDLDRLEKLRQRGFRVDARSPTGETCLHRIAAVLTARADQVAEFLIAWGADVQAGTTEKFQPLHSAAINGHVAVADVLLRHGADINAVTDYGFTPLHYAVSHDQANVVSWLLHRGANVRLKSLASETPLEIAYRHEAWDIAELFWNSYTGTPAAGVGRTIFIPRDVAAWH